MSANVIVNRRLYLDETRTRVLEDGDPDCRFLLCVQGGEIPYEVAAKYDLLDGAPADADDSPEPEPEPEPEPAKAKPAAPNKARTPAANK